VSSPDAPELSSADTASTAELPRKGAVAAVADGAAAVSVAGTAPAAAAEAPGAGVQEAAPAPHCTLATAPDPAALTETAGGSQTLIAEGTAMAWDLHTVLLQHSPTSWNSLKATMR